MGTNRQVEIFEVGKEQLWTWVQHMGRFSRTNPSYLARVWVMDGVSLARGRYVIVSMMVMSDGRGSTPLVCDSFRSKRQALETLDAYEEHQRYLRSHYGDDLKSTECFELWHVVDDGELWGAWQAKVAAAKSHEAVVVDFLCQLFEAGNPADSEPEQAEVLESLRQLREAGEDCEVVEFSDMREACDYVEAALGEHASDYDVEAIAREVTFWEPRPSVLVLRRKGDAFWSACRNHSLAVLA